MLGKNRRLFMATATVPECNGNGVTCPLRKNCGIIGFCDGKPKGCTAKIKIPPPSSGKKKFESSRRPPRNRWINTNTNINTPYL
jgi:hypothetical protein